MTESQTENHIEPQPEKLPVAAPEGKRGAPKKRIKVIPPKTIVRKLAVGQEVVGHVKRLADFGAFIDIGVGTDGLVHVSQISVKRVAKPADVLKVGQEVTAWIRELDKDTNRISLTLISPDTRTIRDLRVGEVIKGQVTRIEKYGIFVDVGVGQDAMVHVKEMSHGYLKHPGDVVQLGDEIAAEIIGVQPRQNKIDLSMRALMPPPEVAPAPASAPVAASAPEQVEDDAELEEEEEPQISAFELALQRAQSNRGGKARQRRKKQWYDAEEGDDIIDRTLALADGK